MALALIATRMLVETRAGLILQAIRDDQNRVRYLGFDVPLYQVFFFAVSAAIAGVAGMLYVVVAQFASPTFMDLSFSITMVVWAAVGGRASPLIRSRISSFVACIGAIGINIIEAGASETQALVQAWRAVIGLIFVLVVLYLPRGVAGFASDAADAVLARFGRKRRPPAAQPAEERVAS